MELFQIDTKMRAEYGSVSRVVSEFQPSPSTINSVITVLFHQFNINALQTLISNCLNNFQDWGKNLKDFELLLCNPNITLPFIAISMLLSIGALQKKTSLDSLLPTTSFICRCTQ